MICPYCNAADTKVIDSRLNQGGDSTRRRRECPVCEGRFTTYERIEAVMPLVIKKDGRREAYSRPKILGGIEKACQKRVVATERMEDIVSRIEKRMQAIGMKEIPSKTVGEMVMTELHRLDKVAYVRFASVYRDFQDVPEFVAELQEPPRLQEDPTNLAFPFVAASDGVPEESSSREARLTTSREARLTTSREARLTTSREARLTTSPRAREPQR